MLTDTAVIMFATQTKKRPLDISSDLCRLSDDVSRLLAAGKLESNQRYDQEQYSEH